MADPMEPEARYYASSDEGEIRRLRATLAQVAAERDAARRETERLTAALEQIIDIMDAEPEATWYGRSDLRRRLLQVTVDAIVTSERS